MKNILVTGSNGQLGKAINLLSQNRHDFNFIFTDIDELDITSESELGSFISENNINFIINCAAYTAVDKAESDSDKAILVNTKAVDYLAKHAKKNDAVLIHISTDYVFDGKSVTAYVETDKPNPNSVYGHTKHQAEIKIEQEAENAVIIRTSWLFSELGNNFVKTMIKLGNERTELKVVNDQFGSPTYASDLAKAIFKLLNKKINGIEIYNYSNEGSCTWYEFAKSIFEIKNIDCKLIPITTEEYPTAAARPKYSLLDKTKIKTTLNINIPDWRESLKICLKNI